MLGCCAALALTLVLGACGSGKHPYDATAENNGYYIKLGTISYQLQVSRELNRFSTEDHQYLAGVTQPAPKPTQIWYGVFLYAINDSKKTAQAADNFWITDTENNIYKPVPLNPTFNGYAWTGATLPAHGTEPIPNSTAAFGPTQGGLVLFKLPTAVYNNRPLTLHIQAPGVPNQGTISLDL